MRTVSFKTSVCAMIVAAALMACGKQDAPPPSMEVPVTLLDVKAGSMSSREGTDDPVRSPYLMDYHL